MKKVILHFFCSIKSHHNEGWLKEWYLVRDIETNNLSIKALIREKQEERWEDYSVPQFEGTWKINVSRAIETANYIK
jgi:hypothetical protein